MIIAAIHVQVKAWNQRTLEKVLNCKKDTTYTATIQDETKRQEEDVKYSDRMMYVTKYKKQIDEWIQSTEQHLSDHLDRQSCYKSTAGSSCSRCSNKALEAKAALAELLVEQELFEKCQQLKLMQLEIEIAKAKARLRIF